MNITYVAGFRTKFHNERRVDIMLSLLCIPNTMAVDKDENYAVYNEKSHDMYNSLTTNRLLPILRT
jgi:hypothetical protein